MKKDVGDWSIIGSGETHHLTYTSATGPIKFVGSRSACERQLAELQEIHEGKKQEVFEDSPKGPMTREEYADFVESVLMRLKETMRRKNADYTGSAKSPFANFLVSEQLGLANAKTGLLIRMVDKIQRLKTFIDKGELQVKNEGAEDAALDIVGYGLLLLGMLEDDRRQK